MKKISIFLFICFLFPRHLNAQNYAFPGALLNVNKTVKIYFNEGYDYSDFFTEAAVVQSPEYIPLVYSDGFLWCAQVEDDQAERERVGGSNLYSNTGTVPGWIENGQPVDYQNNPLTRVFRYRPNFRFLDRDIFAKEAAILFDTAIDSVTQAMVDKIRLQYELDLEQWPVEHGAPFYDIDGDGKYEPGYGEKPYIKGADKIIFFIRNDFDYRHTADAFESLPIRLEYRVTAWAYGDREKFGGTIIEKHSLTSYAEVAIDSMYLGYWSDPDVGDYMDDQVGCDSSKNLAFAYNSAPDDSVFSKVNLIPAAAGYQLLSGPNIYDAEGNTLSSGDEISSFGWVSAGAPSSSGGAVPLNKKDPSFSIYNWLRGFQPTNPATPYIDPGSGQATRFPLSGDPVTGMGDVDSNADEPGDRRMLIATGPFTLMPGETVESIWAIFSETSIDNLASVSKLKYYAAYQAEYWENPPLKKEAVKRNTDGGPGSFYLEPNYPNPFNGVTTIRFSVENNSHVRLDVFNTVGQRVAVLLDGEAPWLKRVIWQPEDLPSGTYIIRLQSLGRKQFIRAVYIK